jgi:hypothetical protein
MAPIISAWREEGMTNRRRNGRIWKSLPSRGSSKRRQTWIFIRHNAIPDIASQWSACLWLEISSMWAKERIFQFCSLQKSLEGCRCCRYSWHTHSDPTDANMCSSPVCIMRARAKQIEHRWIVGIKPTVYRDCSSETALSAQQLGVLQWNQRKRINGRVPHLLSFIPCFLASTPRIICPGPFHASV